MSPDAERRTLVLRGILDVCLLALLEDEPVYGYKLTTRLAERGLAVGNGTAYPLLSRLQRIGLVTVDPQPSATGPTRKYYSLSADGHDALARGRREWTEIADAVASVLESKSGTTLAERNQQ